MNKRFPQSFKHVLAAGIQKAFAAFFGFIRSKATRNLRHGRHVRGVERVQNVNVPKYGVEIAQHAHAFFVRQLKIREFRDVGYVFFSDFHELIDTGLTKQKREGRSATLKRSTLNSISRVLLPIGRMGHDAGKYIRFNLILLAKIRASGGLDKNLSKTSIGQ